MSARFATLTAATVLALAACASPPSPAELGVMSKAETGSITQVPESPRGLRHVTVQTVPESHHLFPMVRADVVRDALFEAAV